MAIGVHISFSDGRLDQYDEVMERMGLSSASTAPPGCLFHWVTATDGGIRVTDVWETQEAFEAFAQTQIAPITQEVGIPGPPDLHFFEVHNYLPGR